MRSWRRVAVLRVLRTTWSAWSTAPSEAMAEKTEAQRRAVEAVEAVEAAALAATGVWQEVAVAEPAKVGQRVGYDRVALRRPWQPSRTRRLVWPVWRSRTGPRQRVAQVVAAAERVEEARLAQRPRRRCRWQRRPWGVWMAGASWRRPRRPRRTTCSIGRAWRLRREGRGIAEEYLDRAAALADKREEDVALAIRRTCRSCPARCRHRFSCSLSALTAQWWIRICANCVRLCRSMRRTSLAGCGWASILATQTRSRLK